MSMISRSPSHSFRLDQTVRRRFCFWGLICLVIFAGGCAEFEPDRAFSPKTANNFDVAETRPGTLYSNPDQVDAFSAQVPDEYLLGPGDILSLTVWNRPELSDPKILVGPDGIISLILVGAIDVNGRTRQSVADEIKKSLSKLYDNPEISLSVSQYSNNKAFVLGRVANPGVVKFPGQGTLLEALSLAGGLPVHNTQVQASLTKCSIIRGRNTIIWIDLNELLYNGNMGLNARIQNNDIIFIPESQSNHVFVMGEVDQPGAYMLTGRESLLSALMRAGGPTRDANRHMVHLIRSEGKTGRVETIDLLDMMETANFSKNYLLQADDVIYVSQKGISRFNYTMTNLLPFLSVINLGTDILESFGVMQQFRNRVWGQEGTVGK